MPRKENNLVLMAVGFAASTMFIVFVCTRLICAHIMQWTASRRSIPTARPRSDLSILERGLHGLEPVLIATFPTKKFSDDFFSSSEDTQCTVCLAEYQQKDTLRVLPYCGHSFHVTCIDIWLQQHSTCPICRISLRESTDRKQTMPPMFRAPLALGTVEPYWYSSQVVSSPQRELVEEDQFPSHLDMVEVREVNSMLTRDNNGVLKSKHVESPSNS